MFSTLYKKRTFSFFCSLNNIFKTHIIPTVAPETVKVRAEPEELKPGIEATLKCDAASSNPPAVLSWWRDGIPVQGKTI